MEYGYQPSYLDAINIFLFELSFLMTLHKAHGKTLKTVILVLSTQPTYQSQIDYFFVVGISRVHCSEDIIVILPSKTDYSSLEYLTHLKQPDHIKQFFNGFRDTDSTWDSYLAYKRMTDSMKEYNK